MNSPIEESDALATLFSEDPHTCQIETDFLLRLDRALRARPNDPEVVLSFLDLLNNLAPSEIDGDADPMRRRFQEPGWKGTDRTE